MSAVDPAYDLTGVTVMITRPEDQAQLLAEKIGAAGGEPLVAPTLAVAPIPVAADSVLTPPPDALVFISRNAVAFGWDTVGSHALAPDVDVFAVGLGTRQEVVNRGVDNVIAPASEFSSEGLLALPALAKERIKGRRIVIVRGQGGRETLRESLLKRGGDVFYLEVYERVLPPTDLASIIARSMPDIAVVSSAQGLTNLAEMIEQQRVERLFDMPLVVPGRRVAAEVAGLGFTQDPVIADNPSDAAFITALSNWATGEL